MPDLSTPRLWLRQWCGSDREPFAALNADPRVMEFMPRCLSRAESDALAQRSEAELAQQGWGFWATERRESSAFIGFVGLHVRRTRRLRSPAAAPWTPAASPRALSPEAHGLAERWRRERQTLRGSLSIAIASRVALSQHARRLITFTNEVFAPK